MIYPVIGIIIGLLIGALFPISIPVFLAKYLSVAVLAALDTAFGGIRSALEDKFNNTVFITGFFTNSLLAVLLVFIGERLSIDLYMVALLAFGLRVFNNLAVIRHHFLKK
ncbi:MAG: small basic family protein [Bacillota bacterium]